jgi:hypothetical protein
MLKFNLFRQGQYLLYILFICFVFASCEDPASPQSSVMQKSDTVIFPTSVERGKEFVIKFTNLDFDKYCDSTKITRYHEYGYEKKLTFKVVMDKDTFNVYYDIESPFGYAKTIFADTISVKVRAPFRFNSNKIYITLIKQNTKIIGQTKISFESQIIKSIPELQSADKFSLSLQNISSRLYTKNLTINYGQVTDGKIDTTGYSVNVVNTNPCEYILSYNDTIFINKKEYEGTLNIKVILNNSNQTADLIYELLKSSSSSSGTVDYGYNSDYYYNFTFKLNNVPFVVDNENLIKIKLNNQEMKDKFTLFYKVSSTSNEYKATGGNGKGTIVVHGTVSEREILSYNLIDNSSFEFSVKK